MDRVWVFREGSLTEEIPRSRLDRDTLVASFFGDLAGDLVGDLVGTDAPVASTAPDEGPGS